MDFDYKKYSLEKLETWVEDALNSAEASPQEIYDCIRKVVEDNYYYYKNSTSRCYELLCLLNGNGKGHIQEYDNFVESKTKLECDKNDPSPECQKAWNSFWEEYYYPEEAKDDGMRPWGHSDLEYRGSTVSNVDLKKEIEKIREEGGYDWTPPTKSEKSEHYYDYTRNDLNRKNPFESKKKWVLPVEECKDADTDETEYFVSFPDDLLEAANLKEGDQVEWVDQGDGSYLIKKAPMTYDEMVAAGWTMTADGFWIKE